MLVLRDYQQEVYDRVHAAWLDGKRAPVAVMPTGAGKTALFSRIIADWRGFYTKLQNVGDAAVAIAHRDELVEQMSLALNRNEVTHRVIASDAALRRIVARHVAEHGRSYHNSASMCAVASVDTLVTERSRKMHSAFLSRVGLVVTDEAHHLLKENKWGRALLMFPNSVALGVTATPIRADGKGLGVDSDGVFDVLIEGPTMRDLITRGFLCDYFRPDGTIAVHIVPQVSPAQLREFVSSTTGDYVATKVRKVLDLPDLVGDVPREYLRHAAGCRGITFAIDIEHATHIADGFNAQGVPAAVVSSKSSASDRNAALAKFRAGELLQLVNVDLFGEGFDVPACDVVSFARPTLSYSLYAQQFGRAARILPGKTHFRVIDHVGNILVHGLPDTRSGWTLDKPINGGGSGGKSQMPLSYCLNVLCAAPYEAYLKACPMCGTPKPPPAQRDAPEHVDGDLAELTKEAWEILANKWQTANTPPPSVEDAAKAYRLNWGPEKGVGRIERAAEKKIEQWNEDMQTRADLVALMQLWSGYQGDMPIPEQHRKFFLLYGVDYMTAQTLTAQQSAKLLERIAKDLT